MRNPETKAEWQDAVDHAHWALSLDAGRQYGLIVGGPDVNIERCSEILRLGEAKGIVPTPGCIERITNQVLAMQIEEEVK